MAAERRVGMRALHLEPHAAIVKMLVFSLSLDANITGMEQQLAELFAHREAHHELPARSCRAISVLPKCWLEHLTQTPAFANHDPCSELC